MGTRHSSSPAEHADSEPPVRNDTLPVPRVLIVEDERLVAADLSQTVADLGYEPCGTAGSCTEALALAEEARPDIALMDIRIHGPVDGIETATRLQAKYGTSIIFLTAHADDRTIARTASAMPLGYLVKPVSAPALKAAIELARQWRQREDWSKLRDSMLQGVDGQLATALDHLHLAVLVEDDERHVTHVNRQFLRLFGLEPEGCRIGANAADVHRFVESLCLDPNSFRAVLDALQQRRELTTGDLIHLRDERILERDYVPFRESGRHRGTLWVYRDVTERELERRAVEDSAVRNRYAMLVDELTLLHNRRGFNAFAAAYLRYLRRNGEHKVLFFVDLDGLKAINDEYGHSAGDEAIRTMANVLRETFRDSDLLARLGGDEFVVLTSMEPKAVPELTQRLHARLLHLNATRQLPYTLSASVGSVNHDAGESLEAFLARADAAMYAQKRAHRPRSDAAADRPATDGCQPS